MPLDDWQEDVLKAALGERTDGRWAARLVGVSTPRQNGKSQLIVARALAGVLIFGERTIICSAHQTDTAREVFQRILDVVEANQTLERRVSSVMRAINREYIRFASGQVIRVKARSISGGRGFSADCLLLDEAQILGAPAWSAILPTMSARENPQAWLLGTPPTAQDDGEVFSRLRDGAISGRDTRVAYLEWSAEPDDDFDDPETWARANPAFGTRINRDGIETERAAMSDEQFGMERLGMWASSAKRGVIPLSSWGDCADSTSVATDRLALGIEVGPDQGSAAVALAGVREDRRWHVELDEQRAGATWLAPYVDALVVANPQIRAVVGDVGGPLAALVEKDARGRYVLKGTRVVVTAPTVRELGSGCSNLLAGVVTATVVHTGQPQLTSAVAVAGKRALGDTGLWTFARAGSSSDITPVQAVALALHGAQAENVVKPVGRVRTGEAVFR